MAYKRTRKDLEILVDRLNESFKKKYPHGATFMLIRYQGRGYQLQATGHNYVSTFPSGSVVTRSASEMDSFLEGAIAGLSL